jgi:hypothetical protein
MLLEPIVAPWLLVVVVLLLHEIKKICSLHEPGQHYILQGNPIGELNTQAPKVSEGIKRHLSPSSTED